MPKKGKSKGYRSRKKQMSTYNEEKRQQDKKDDNNSESSDNESTEPKQKQTYNEKKRQQDKREVNNSESSDDEATEPKLKQTLIQVKSNAKTFLNFEEGKDRSEVGCSQNKRKKILEQKFDNPNLKNDDRDSVEMQLVHVDEEQSCSSKAQNVQVKRHFPIMYNASYVLALFHRKEDNILSDVIMAAVELLRQQDSTQMFSIGNLSPSICQSSCTVQQPCVIVDKISIDFFMIDHHWIMVIYYPRTNYIHVYDSKRNENRPKQILPLLRQVYEDRITLQNIIYPHVSQQPEDDPTVGGVYAVAFAFSYLLGRAPEIQTLLPEKMRDHFCHCLQTKSLLPFPTAQKQSQLKDTTTQRDKNRLRKQKSREDSLKRVEENEIIKHNRQNRTVILPLNQNRKTTGNKTLEVEYKQKARQSQSVKMKQLERKQKSRNNPLIRQKELELKRNARLKPEVKLKESQSKKKMRELNPTKIKQQELKCKKEARKDPLVRKKELQLKREARKDPLVRIKELQLKQDARKNLCVQKKELELKQKARLKPEVKLKESQSKKKMRELNPTEIKQQELKCKKEARKDPLVRKKELQLKREARKDPLVRIKELQLKQDARKNLCVQKKELELKQKARLKPEVKLKESQSKKKMRELNPTKIKQQELKGKKEARKDPLVRKKELQLKQEVRKDPLVRKKELQLKQEVKKDPLVRKKELQLKQEVRKDPLVRKKELQLKQDARKNPKLKQKEAFFKKKSRENSSVRQREADSKKARYHQSHSNRSQILERKRKWRENCFVQEAERVKAKYRRIMTSSTHENYKASRSAVNISADEKEQLIEKFKDAVSKACDYECTCCGQLFFKQSVVRVPSLNITDDIRTKCITGTKDGDGKEWICHTCLNYLRKNKIPPLSKANNMVFPDKPEVLQLNTLEERLVSPLNVFMQMRELPRGKQVCVKGNVVNVPADNLQTVSSLPRRLDQSDTIPVKLKRRLRYKTHYLYENVRPNKCVAATQYLMQKDLYKKHVSEGVDQNWNDHMTNMAETEWNEFVGPSRENRNREKQHDKHNLGTQKETLTNQDGNDIQPEVDNPYQDTNHQAASIPLHTTEDTEIQSENNGRNDPSDANDESDQWSEDEDENTNPHALLDTMMFEQITEYDGQHNISVAPSEGNIPISIFSDDVEELAFPSIFCGERRPKNTEVHVNYSDICKSELRRNDRRASTSIGNLFFKARKIQLKQIKDKVWLSMRRNKTKGKTYTVKDVKNPDTVEQMVKLDEGYRIFRTLRGSPPYWENAKKGLFAMIRQLGIPTIFITLSAAETHWTPLLKSLARIIDKKYYTEEELKNLTWEDKSRLIRSDPVTVARYFDFRVQQFFRTFLLISRDAPLGNVKEFFYRIEFQQRGSPHIHGVLWIENAPQYGTDDAEKIEEFIGKIISTSATFDPLVSYQRHRHSNYCRKNNKKQCRFYFPIPPMKSTEILEPLMIDDEKELQKHKENWKTISDTLQDLDRETTQSYKEFVKSINLSEDDYVKAVRSTLKEPRIFHKRDPDATRINAYSPCIIKAWQANHDIQYILDAYACAMYIVSYISKGQRGMSNLLRRACDEAKEKGSTIRNQVKAIGNKFSKNVEISAQEAVYITLQLPLRRCSTAFVFINTSPPEERPFILKSDEQLKNLPDDSEDIQCPNLISRYQDRPDNIATMCLADFAAVYDIVFGKAKKQQNIDEDDIGDQDEEYDETAKRIQLSSNSYLRKRRKKKVIRSVRYNRKKDPENHYRELLMLYVPWRREDRIIQDSETYEAQYELMKEPVNSKKSEYENIGEELDEAEQRLQDEEVEDSCYDNVAPNAQEQEQRDREADELEDLGDENLFTNYDIGPDIGITERSEGGTDQTERGTDQTEQIRNRVTDAQYRQDVRSLNKKQRQVFNHILKSVKTSDDQFFIFLSGGAGVGKTRLTKTLNQALLRHYNTVPGANPELSHILLTAPTGKAAYLIGGRTIHSAFKIPANQNLKYKPLKSDTLNSLRCQLSELRTLIIDEISMCGCNMFMFIDLRLQEVMQVKQPFGGVNVLCIGDLFQLHPVMDSWIFDFPKDDYSALSPNVWIDNFQLFELTEIMRQAGDKEFAQALNNIREGCQTGTDIDLIKSRMIEIDNTEYPVQATHILYYNKSVEDHNNRLYDMANTDKISCKSIDLVVGDVLLAVKEKILSKAPTRAGDAMGLSKVYKTAVGLRNELTVNIDVTDGLVNGASGITKKISLSSTGQPCIIWIKFDSEEIGKELRRNSRNLFTHHVHKDWTPIKRIEREFPVGKYKNAKLHRKQFPLQLSCAKTVHRCQGDTLQETVVQLPSERRAHVHYVALSRVTTLRNLYILPPFDATKITVSDDVKREMERLRQEKQVKLCYTPLYSIPEDHFKICFHNAQSVPLHFEDIKADLNFLSSDVLIFAESKLCSTDKDPVLPGFNVSRNDFSNSRSPYGTVVFVKNHVQYTFQKCNYEEIEMTLIRITQACILNILAAYIRPGEKLQNIRKALTMVLPRLTSVENCVVAGDFNNDERKTLYLNDFFTPLQFHQLIHEETTNNHTTIDLMYSNLHRESQQSGILESYYSHHKSVWISIDQEHLRHKN